MDYIFYGYPDNFLEMTENIRTMWVRSLGQISIVKHMKNLRQDKQTPCTVPHIKKANSTRI